MAATCLSLEHAKAPNHICLGVAETPSSSAELKQCWNFSGNFTGHVRATLQKHGNKYRVFLWQKNATLTPLCWTDPPMRPQICSPNFLSCPVQTFLWPIRSFNSAVAMAGGSDIFMASQTCFQCFVSMWTHVITGLNFTSEMKWAWPYSANFPLLDLSCLHRCLHSLSGLFYG